MPGNDFEGKKRREISAGLIAHRPKANKGRKELAVKAMGAKRTKKEKERVGKIGIKKVVQRKKSNHIWGGKRGVGRVDCPSYKKKKKPKTHKLEGVQNKQTKKGQAKVSHLGDPTNHKHNRQQGHFGLKKKKEGKMAQEFYKQGNISNEDPKTISRRKQAKRKRASVRN